VAACIGSVMNNGVSNIHSMKNNRLAPSSEACQ